MILNLNHIAQRWMIGNPLELVALEPIHHFMGRDMTEITGEGIGERLTQLLKEKERKQIELANYLGVAKSSASNLCTGVTTKIDAEYLIKSAEFFEVSPEWLLTGKGSKIYAHQKFLLIPFINQNVEDEDSEPYMIRKTHLTEKGLSLRHLVMIRHIGHLLTDWISDGDFAVIDKSNTKIKDHGLFCIEMPGDPGFFQLRHFTRMLNGKLKMYASQSEIVDDADVKIIGKASIIIRYESL
ncbi:MAG: helix-turn-helix transcriptional regulator [Magnetococcales bacterium]|nr:helix-turn-helix transcriptional regulator [Magnetococcales bacterium]